MDDWSLLQQYVRDGSRAALEELVRRHVAMVYGVALRQVGEPHLAQDVTQVVFLVLMRRADRISSKVLLGGWLFKVTVFTASKMRRSEWRRQAHERKAAAIKTEMIDSPMPELPPPESPQAWTKLLDEAIAAMPGKDRDAVVMRYLQGKSYREVAEAQNITEAAARKRLFRALGKMRDRFVRKGIKTSQDAIDAALLVALPAPPAELTARIISSLHASATAGTSAAAAATILRIMLMAKLKTTASLAIILLLLCGIGGGVVYWLNSGKEQPVAVTPSAPANSSQLLNGNTPNTALVNTLNAVLAGDAKALIDSFEPLSTEQQATLRKMALGMSAEADLRLALAQRFGQGPAERLTLSLGIDPPPSIVAAIAVIPATINGDAAEINLPHVGIVHFVKAGNVWKLKADLSMMGGFSQISNAVPQLQQIISDLNGGKYTEIAQVQQDLHKVLTNAANPDPAPPPDRPQTLGPQATPQATLAAWYWAMTSGDADAAVSCLQNPSPHQESAARLNTALFAAGEQIRLAIAEKFSDFAARDTILTLGLHPGISKKLLDSAPTITGDKAQLDFSKTLGIIMNLTRSDGVWRIDPDFLGKANPQWAQRLGEYYLPKFQQLASDVQAGNFPTVGALRASVQSLHQEMKADHDRFAPPATSAAK